MLLLNLILIKITFGGFPSYDFLMSSLLKLFLIALALLRVSVKIAPLFGWFAFLGLFLSPFPTPPEKKKDVLPKISDISSQALENPEIAR